MLALIEITKWHWGGFIIGILFFLALDLGVFHRKAHVVHFREAAAWTVTWFCLAMAFAFCLRPLRGADEAMDFVNGYLIELSLSMDNVFVIAVIFGFFRVPSQYQHRALFWGILGALVMRGVMIWLGVELVERYEWVLYVFGVFLVLTGVKMLIGEEEEKDLSKNPILRFVSRRFPVSSEYDGQRFITLQQGKRVLTPLALVLVMVESADLVFALDSIPAILSITTQPFIVFTSNVFAILGLRSLYFVLARATTYFEGLKYGLAVILAFIGFKMLIKDFWKISSKLALLVVASVIVVSIVASIFMARRQRNGKKEDRKEP